MAQEIKGTVGDKDRGHFSHSMRVVTFFFFWWFLIFIFLVIKVVHEEHWIGRGYESILQELDRILSQNLCFLIWKAE